MKTVLANNQIYHIYNIGLEGRNIFSNKRDYHRFIDSINHYRIKNPASRFSFKNRAAFTNNLPTNTPLVEILSFCLVPNHFHLIIKQVEENGITNFMSKLSNSYTKYFNSHHQRSGPLFQGNFKAVRVPDDEPLLHLTKYIHLHPVIDYLVKNLRDYPYSSYLEFLNLASGFCQTRIILDYFESLSQFEKFILNQTGYEKSLQENSKLFIDTKKNSKVSP